jgi:hypothetical protein
MELSVILLNRTELTNGKKGPILTPFTATPEELIKELDTVKPVPTFRTGNKELTKEFLESLIKTSTTSKEVLEEKTKVAAPEEKKEEKKVEDVKPVNNGNKPYEKQKFNNQNGQKGNNNNVVTEASKPEVSVEKTEETKSE